MSEEELELFKRAQAGNREAVDELMNNYKSLVSVIARRYYLSSEDIEELIQEGMMGLYRAITTYDPQKNTSFKAYADRVIENKMIDDIRRTTSKKNQVLSESIFIDDDDSLSSDDPTPENTFISEESVSEMLKEIEGRLGKFEKEVMERRINGLDYLDIAKELGEDPKAIDNALSRIKRKLKYLKEWK